MGGTVDAQDLGREGLAEIDRDLATDARGSRVDGEDGDEEGSLQDAVGSFGRRAIVGPASAETGATATTKGREEGFLVKQRVEALVGEKDVDILTSSSRGRNSKPELLR